MAWRTARGFGWVQGFEEPPTPTPGDSVNFGWESAAGLDDWRAPLMGMQEARASAAGAAPQSAPETKSL